MSTQINTEYWGNDLSVYADNNVRTGASDLSNADFTDYPPFVRNDYNYTGELIQYINEGDLYYSQLIDNPVIKLNEPFDTSIAYCACKNMEIPINQIIGFSSGSGVASGVYPDVSEDSYWLESKQEPLPLMFLSRIGLSNVLSRGVSGSQYVFNPEYTTSSGIAYCQETWCPHASNTNPQGQEGSPDTNTGRGRSNKNLFLQFWRDFGIRTVFLQIDLKYFDGTYSATTGTPQNVNTTSLYAYSQNTLEWRMQHPILCAWSNVVRRINIDGTYGTSGGDGDLTPDLTHNLVSRFQYGSIAPNTPILQPMAMYDTNDLSSHGMVIFGGVTAKISASQNMGTNPNGGVSQYIAVLVGGSNGNVTRKQGTGSYARTCWLEMEGNDGNLENLRKWCAAYGLFFTDGRQTDSGYNSLYYAGNDNTRWTNEKMCLGVVDDDGYTDGTYTRGTDNETANNWDWKTASQSPYDPSRPPPTPTMSYDSVTTFNDISNIATLTRRYALTKQDVEDLGSELWQISSDIINNIQNDEWYKYTADVMDTFLVTDPLSCIVSLQKYPMTIPEQSGPVMVKLGKAETSISANITKATAKTYYFTPVKILPRFGNSFMDYEPYTHFELYVPFCGTTELDPRDILGRTLSINLVVDFNTGTCVAYVLSDSLVIETINGSLAIDIPVTGVDSTTIASNITQGIINTRNARYTHQFGTLGKVASPSGIISNVGNVWGSAQSILTSENNAKLNEYELTHQPAQPHVIGSASPVGSWAIDFKCRLLIYYPTGGIVDEGKVADSSYSIAFNDEVYEQYKSQIGFATVDPVSSLGASYAHTLVCAEKAILNNITTPNGRPATEPELQLIRQALQEGVILP